jgi:CheY-like chemotaxis protein
MPMPGVGPTPVVQPPDVQHRHTVLLAEDNDVNAIVATSMLERLGITVERAIDGHEAVLRVCRSSGRPEMVLMDCHMPGMDGFEATRLIRQFERRHNLPRIRIVALTANAAAQDRDRCLTAGMDAHLAKPFGQEELLHVLVSEDAAGNAVTVGAQPPRANAAA